MFAGDINRKKLDTTKILDVNEVQCMTLEAPFYFYPFVPSLWPDFAKQTKSRDCRLGPNA